VKKWNKYTLVSFLIVFLVLIADQVLKIWVKTNMQIGEIKPVMGHWFNLFFVENEGMAFGLSFGPKFGKIILTFIRIGVASFLIYYLAKIIKQAKADFIIVTSFSLIIAGALGNIIDSLFYGIFYDYAPLMLGKVVDMFYFQLFRIPSWVPLWGGNHFFPAIFNIADSCVTVGVLLVLIFNKRFFPTHKPTVETTTPETESTPQQPE
jgi:signal peptidase II